MGIYSGTTAQSSCFASLLGREGGMHYFRRILTAALHIVRIKATKARVILWEFRALRQPRKQASFNIYVLP